MTVVTKLELTSQQPEGSEVANVLIVSRCCVILDETKALFVFGDPVRGVLKLYNRF